VSGGVEHTLAPPVRLTSEPVRTVRLESVVDERTRALLEMRRAGKAHPRGWAMRRALLAADAVSLTAAFLLAQWSFRGDSPLVDRVSPMVEIATFIVILPLWLLLARGLGLYARDEERADHRSLDDTARVFTVVTIGTWFLLTASWLTQAADPHIPKLLTLWAASVTFVSVSRLLARSWVRRSLSYIQNTVIVGAGEIGQLVASKVLRHPEYGINLLGFVDEVPTRRRGDLGDLSLLGRIDELPMVVRELDVDRVIVAFDSNDRARLMRDLRPLRHRNVQVDVVPRLFDIVGPGAEVHAIEGVHLVGLPPVRLPLGSRVAKRSFDVFGSLAGIILLLPLFVFIAVGIKRDSEGPVFFRQARPGREGVLFNILKFRTMHVAGPGTVAADPIQGRPADDEYEKKFKLRDDPRATPFGRQLRRFSLDELPQLWNVLRGEMSLVGPRPMLLNELERRKEILDELLMVKPGMTGYWQVNGRSDTDYDDRLRLELSYIASWSIGLDLSILARTVTVLVSGRGAS